MDYGTRRNSSRRARERQMARQHRTASTAPLKDAIREAGFEPQLRNQQYGWREIPKEIEEQVINY